MIVSYIVVTFCLFGTASGFLPSRQLRLSTPRRQLLRSDKDPLFASIPNLGISLPGSVNGGALSSSSSVSSDDGVFEASSVGLIRQARRLLASDFGILDPSLLDDNEFIWIGPFVDEPLSKLEYLAAGRFFDLRTAFPDLDYRSHDFRIEDSDPYTIRFTCRVTGTMRGALRLRDGTLPPTGKRMICPPEAVTVTFNKFGKVIKLCTGFCVDRQVGNTKGATGVMAAAVVAGQPPSDWDLYPAPTVVGRFFGRPLKPLVETKSVLAPFPETVMVQLAKGILATNMAANDPSLLSDKFEFITPYFGPIRKPEFLEKYALEQFDNVDPYFSNFRVDPYDPVRVWVDVLPRGIGYQGCPQAMSFSFDEEGFCERISSSYVMDPSIGNGGGLGGPEGYRYAMGKGDPDILTRPWARVLGRARKQVLSPLTGVGVDDYLTPLQARSKTATAAMSGATEKEPQLLQSKPTETLSGLKSSVVTPAPPALAPLQSFNPFSTREAEIRQREAAAAEEEAKLKMKGAEEARLLMIEMEAAEKKALEAKAKLEKLEAQMLESGRRLKLALEPQKVEPAVPTEQKQKVEDQIQTSPLESAKALVAEVAAKRTEQLEAIRIASANLLKEFEANLQAQAEERRKQLEEQNAEAARKRAEEAAKLTAEQEARKTQLAKQQAEAKQRAELKAAAEAKKRVEDAKLAAEQEARNKQLAQQQAAAFKRAELKAAAEAKKKAEEAAKLAAADEARIKQLAKQQAEAEKKADLSAAAKKSPVAKARTPPMESKKAEQKNSPKTIPSPRKNVPGEEDSEAAKQARAARQKAALESLTSAVARATISLFGISDTSSSSRSIPIQSPTAQLQPKARTSSSRSITKPAPTTVQPPKGVPVLRRWKKTLNGAVTGAVSGSRLFPDGERITTSPIVQGTIASGEVVRTGSGSRYFLE